MLWRKMSPESSRSGKICVFCNDPEDNEIKYGKIYEHNGIITHYYCLLLSSNMQQRGGDDEGILGFLPADINRELNRGKRLLCSFCKKKGATLGCVNKKCKRVFHLPCGLRNNTLHQFFDQFKSFCQSHRPKQHIDLNVLKSTPERTTCWICFDSASRQDIFRTLWAPCCKKNAWFHRDCVQQLALSAGYFFKCPLCNNKKEFQSAMQECGIFVPSQDASWELVPNAFQELLYRHNRCDASECKCPQGRDYNSATNSQWEMVLCRTCGSQGTHVTCGNLRWAKSWDCKDCVTILSKKFAETNARVNGTHPQDENNDVSIDSDEDEDSGVSRSLDISAINLKPGPRSAKLKQLHQTARQLTDPASFQQLQSLLDQQQAQTSQGARRNLEEEEEISILEVREVPGRASEPNSPEKMVDKYPELSINWSRKATETPGLLPTPGTSVQARNLPKTPQRSVLRVNRPECVPRNKLVDDVIVVDSDDEEQSAGTSQIESSCFGGHPDLVEEPQDCSGVMNIKITAVTSLAPEEFAQVPDNSTNASFEDPIPVIESSNFGTEERSSSVFAKRKADSPSVLSTLVDRVNNVIDTNSRELMRASLPSKKLRFTSGTPVKIVSSQGSNFAAGMTRIIPPTYNLIPSGPVTCNGGISRTNTPMVKVYNKQYLVPMGQERHLAAVGSISSVSSASSIGSEQPEKVPSDGDAGSEPASEFTLPPTTPATTSAGCQPGPEAYPSSPPPPSSSSPAASSALQPEFWGASTSAAEAGTLPAQNIPAGPPEHPGGAARTRITKTSKHNPADQHIDRPGSDRFGLRDQKILLSDLKLRLCSDNSLEITAYDNYRMNINLEAAMRTDSGSQRLRSSRSNVCVVKPRSSRVRGPKSKRMKYENSWNSIENKAPDTLSASEKVKDAEPEKTPPAAAATAIADSGSSSESNFQLQTDPAKENLVPDSEIGQSRQFAGRKLRSSKCLADFESKFNKNHVNIQENSQFQDGDLSCHVSIDLSRIRALIDSKPNLFIKKTQSFEKLPQFADAEINYEAEGANVSPRNGKLKRSCSCDSIFPANHGPAAGVGMAESELSGKMDPEGTGGSQKSRKKKRGRSFKNNSRVR